ncbi:amidase [Corynebacterium pseudopelargi]|uniref:amidase n=1 Tax=Corynebacterium pseudopelargi TaxID=2080757 RepID=A0A3G6IRX7_9CORY|nr:amidase [Corynebacterium pseudopelargi]AZA08303.1 Enantioselective amidase [Corynebacterium pseudopelargi]
MHQDVETLAQAVATMDPSEHGFAYFDSEAAHRQVGALGDLSGWIIPAKDLSDVKGMPTTFGNVSRSRIATETDPFLAALQARGAIIPGKTLTCEMGLSAYTEPVGQPAPVSPSGATPGGSSGGAAVAVARGLVRAAHGSDGGGSIRIPAACCNIIGFKPPHNTRRANPVAQGFLTSSLADVHRLYRIAPQAAQRQRIGVLLEPVHAEVTVAEHMLTAVDHAASHLAALGHEVQLVGRPYGDAPFQAFADILALRSSNIPGDASPLVQWLRERGTHISSQRAQVATAEFLSVHEQLLAAWNIDILLTPTIAFDPPPLGYFSSMAPEEDFHAQTQWTPWATMCNMAGIGAIALPGKGASIHLAAIRASIPQLLAVAAQAAQSSARS